VVGGAGAVQVDIAIPNAADPMRPDRVGAIRLGAPGPFSVAVPVNIARVEIQAFQDPEGDGPDGDDPFATTTVQKGAGARLVLATGRGDPGTAGASPGAPPTAVGGPTRPPDGPNFPPGPTVTLSGTIRTTRAGPVVVDFFLLDGSGPAGRTFLGRKSMETGAFSIPVTRDLGRLQLEAYQDLTGDSRTADDPFTRLDAPVTIGASDVGGVLLSIP
jgi:hypothetical protein